MNEFEQKSVEYRRSLLAEKLNQCTEDQISIFNKMYESIDVITEEKMAWAYRQITRSLEKNAEKVQ